MMSSGKINSTEEMKKGFDTAFIDGSLASDPVFRTQFLSNDHTEGRKVLSSIEDELERCDEFCISVAFITRSGIEPLLMTLKELEARGIKGRILTTDYLGFSEPGAIDTLAQLSNIDVRMYETRDSREGFHTKGYIFRNDEIYTIITGSSNMTQAALATNREWNTKIVSKQKGEIAENVLSEFEKLWSSKHTKEYKEFIERYRLYYKTIKEQKKIAALQEIPSFENYQLTPNKMQTAFMNNLHKLVQNGKKRILLISATGTGKTYASAFALRNERPERILFIVHREQIARQAMESYKRVFGVKGGSGKNDNEKRFGLISGSSRDFDSKYVFSTMQMMSKQSVLEYYDPASFDIIVIDEVHRAGADSYGRIMDHFDPKFWLGMTASPERTDGFDIYGLFDHNIAYEIRLQQALEENMLCPFHYFGITDLQVDGRPLDENRDFQYLTCDERVDHVIEQAEYFGYSGDRVKGLVFCSRRDEAEELSKKFNERGYRSACLFGDNKQDEREEYIERLTGKDNENALDYIFTIDIFNEGVDIPEINQVIMLRPTQSPIIFVQQLGRGLRKADGKEFVVVLDFIGNYSSNFMIPIALSGDRSYNKDNMRKYVSGGTRVIPGSSSIHFDEIAKKQIYASIDSARTGDLKLIKDSYTNLKNKLGRIPKIREFEEYEAIDVMKIFDKCGSYRNFLCKYEPYYKVVLNADESIAIEFISCKLAAGKRFGELLLIKMLISQSDRRTELYKDLADLDEISEREFGRKISDKEKFSIIRNLTNMFAKKSDRPKYRSSVFLKEKDGRYTISPDFLSMLENSDFKEMVYELADFGLERYKKNYADVYKDTEFCLYKKYTYEDVCLLMNWETNATGAIFGYFYDKKTKTLPVFINYEKDDEAIAYEDRFVSSRELIALSKHPRKVDSSDADHFYKRTESDKDNHIYLFVRKNKDDKEAKEFYFLGEIEATGEPDPIKMKMGNGKEDDAFEIDYRLDVPVREDIYKYITGE